MLFAIQLVWNDKVYIVLFGAQLVWNETVYNVFDFQLVWTN